MNELIKKLEEATGPDRGLFWDAFSAVWPDGAPHEIWLRFATLIDNEAWLDAALTLVPKDWQWSVSNRAPKPHAGRAYIHNGELQLAGIGGMRRNPAYRGEECTAHTPAIALCIASLKALKP